MQALREYNYIGPCCGEIDNPEWGAYELPRTYMATYLL